MEQAILRSLRFLPFFLLFSFLATGQISDDVPVFSETGKGQPKQAARKAFSSTTELTASQLAEAPNVNVSNLTGNEAEVSISVNPNNRNNQVIAGHAPGAATLNTFFSTDGGRTWTLVGLGPAQDGLPAGVRFDPTVAFAGDGNVYVAYGVIVSGTDRRLVVARSTNGGASYDQFTTVRTDASLDKWIINTGRSTASASQFNVYLAYRVTESGNVVTRLASSTDQGATFPTDVQVNDGGNLNTFGMPAVGPNGEVYVVWDDQSGMPGASNIRVDVSTDNGATLGADRLVSTTPVNRGNTNRYDIPAQPDRGVLAVPSIAVDRSGGPFHGTVYVAYTTVGGGGFNDTDIAVRRSTDGGVTWSAPVIVNNDGGTNSQFLPWLDVDQVTGQVVVVWYDARNDVNNQQVEVFLGSSNDGGLSFTNVLVSDGASDQSTNNTSRWGNNFLEYIGVSSLNGVASVVWSDNSLNAADLDYFTDQIPIGAPPVADAGPDQTVECAGPSGTTVNLDGSGSTDPNGDPLTYTWSENGVVIAGPSASPMAVVSLPLGTHTLTLTVDDGNLLSDTDEVIITIADTQPPVITLNGSSEITLECGVDTYSEAGAVATDVCDASVPVSISGTVDSHTPGTYIITYNATDASGNNAIPVSRTVKVQDTTPPVITVSSPPASLWPPNHKYHTIALADLNISVTDACDTEVSPEDVVIVQAVSDEPEDARGNGDGATLNDMVISNTCRSVDLRAERQGKGDGRVYTLTLQVTDASGNVGTAYYQIHVPHHVSAGPLAIGGAAQYTVLSPACPPAATAVASARKPLADGEQDIMALPVGYAVETNYPNPFYEKTTIRFALPQGEQVRVRVFNMMGQEVELLLNEYRQAGRHELTFDGANLSSGTYLFRFESSGFSVTRRMVLIK